MINLDYQSRTPIYEQIVNQVERLISLGILKPKQQIQSIRELATSLGINPNTVKKAYEELEKRGAINTISTKGTFVTDNIKLTVNRTVNEKMDIIRKNINELLKLGVDKDDIMKKVF
ncbi:MAG: GntR family transcriptional regulator [Clostridia bacterium]|nr:GntR family transcriptional regulator [Clostridia bacterium]